MKKCRSESDAKLKKSKRYILFLFVLFEDGQMEPLESKVTLLLMCLAQLQ